MVQHRPIQAAPLRDDPALRAEMATLGAMLVGPELIGRAGELSPGDFRSPVHAALAGVILDAREEGLALRRPPPEPGHPAGSPEALAEWTNRWLHDVVWERARLHPAMEKVSSDYLVELIAASPYPPRIGWYAQIVREHAARTRIAMLAVDHASALAQNMPLVQLRKVLDKSGRQIENAAEGLTPPTGVERDLARPPAQPEETGLGSLLPRPPPAPEVTETEDRLLGALLARNHLTDPVARIVERRDFHGPGRSLLYGLVEEMHRENMPIDAVTISPAAESLGALSTSRTGDGRLTLDGLFRLARPADEAHAVQLARQVQHNGIRLNLRHSLRHLVDTANHTDVPARAVREEVATTVQSMAAMRGRLAIADEVKDHGLALAPQLGR
ncbi:MAG: hypothetical protein L0Y54_22245 [Sporichthyaceae bacterium]|nr:hypothetical protein [Sporichthyaceae bacterium]